MTPTRAAVYIGALSLIAAWFASAAGVIGQPRPSRPVARSPVGTSGDAVGFDVHAQAERLQRRLASAPTPQEPVRNPFTFRPRQPVPAPRVERDEPPPVAEPIVQPEPELTLIGIAEDKTAAGLVRTAMIVDGGGELMMAKVGDRIGEYTVKAIGADAVELTHATARIRRLALQ